MGPQEDYVETVFTCEGDINDPNLQTRLEDFKKGLRDLLSTDKRKLILKKVEPWNSVRVTFNIPLEAARRLKQLAQQGNSNLRQLGVLAVQLEGDQLISLTIAGRNNERTQLIFKTANDTVDASTTALSVINSHGALGGAGVTDYGSSGANSIEATQKNIAEYLRQGSSIHVFDSFFPSQQNSTSDIHRTPNVATSICDSIPSNSVFVSSANISPTQSSSMCGPLPGHPSGLVSPGFLQGNSELPSPTSNKPGHSKFVTSPGFPHGIPQSQPGIQLGLPPPPPYPMGSALLNSISKSGRVGMPTTSPLLVNLLQTDPHLAGLNFVNSKMLPPAEASPPAKKKRRPRKPKDKNKQTISSPPEGEISIQSVPNPGLDSCGLPLVTSGGSSNMPTIPMVTQALPASTQPAVTFTTTQGKQPSLVSNNSTTVSSTDHFSVAKQQYQDLITSGRHVENPGEQYLSESTAGKIINPYTGLLEPMENSDSSPCKSDSSLDGSSPRKKHNTKHSPKERKSSAGCVANKPVVSTLNTGSISSNDNAAVPSNASAGLDSVARRQLTVDNHVCPVSASPHSDQTVSNKIVHSSHDFPASVSTYTSKDLATIDDPKQGLLDPDHKNISHTSVPTSDITIQNVHLQHSFTSSVTDSDSPLSNTSIKVNDKVVMASRQALSHSAHNIGSAKPIHQTPANHQHPAFTRTGKDSNKMLSDNTSPTADPEHLLNMPHLHTSKNPHIGSLIIDSPGGDSENSSQSSLLHDSHMQNDIGAVSSVCTIETKSLNHDSGVGSSSERSDDTPSEPGDTDFKTGHGVEEISRLQDSGMKNINQNETRSKIVTDGFVKMNCEHNGKTGNQRYNNSGSSVQNIVTQPNMDFTVGYAIADSINIQQQEKKMGTDISTIMAMDKVLNHPAFNNINSKSHLRNNLGKDNSVTVLHWSTTDKFLCNQLESKHKSQNQYVKDGTMSNLQNCFQQQPFSQRIMQQTALSVKNADTLQPTSRQNSGNSGSDMTYSSDFAACQSISSSEYGNMLQNCKDNNRLSPCSQNQSGTQIPSPHLLTNHNGSSIKDRNILCNTVNSSQCMLVNDINSSINMSLAVSSEQLKHRKYSKSPHSDLKNKSPISAVIRTSSYDNVMTSVSCTLEKKNDLHVTQGYDGNMMNTGSSVPKVENGSKLPSSSSNSLDATKTANVTSMYKRRSPAGSMLNSLPQHFFNPALPLAKSLTESVQKLVKPLPSIDTSSLPHQQRKSPVSTASKSMAATSPPRPAKGKSPGTDSKTSRSSLPTLPASVISGHDPAFSSDITNTLHVLNDHNTSSQGIENLILPILSKTAELPILDLESSHGLDFGSSLAEENNTNAETSDHKERNQNNSNSLLESSISTSSTFDILNELNVTNCKESNGTCTIDGITHDNPFVDKLVKSETKQPSVAQPLQGIGESKDNHFLSQNDLKSSVVSQASDSISNISLQNLTKVEEMSTDVHSITQYTDPIQGEKSAQTVEDVNINLIKNEDCNVSNIVLESSHNCDESLSTCKIESDMTNNEKKMLNYDLCGDSNKNIMKMASYEETKSSSSVHKLNTCTSDIKKHSTCTTVDHSLKPQKMDLEDKKVEVTVVTKPKHLTADSKMQDKSEPTVPPIILRVRRKSISEPSESSEESHSTMTLRGRNNNKNTDTATVEVSVNSQSKLQKSTRSRSSSNEQAEKQEKLDQCKSSSVDEDNTKRNLRRRKNTQDIDTEAKKMCLDSDEVSRHTRSSDVKDQNINDHLAKSTKIAENKEVNAINVTKFENNKVNDGVIPPDSAENLTLFDTVKSGLRARDKNKTTGPEEKVKCASKEIKDVKKVKIEDDINNKNRQANKRNRLSPTFQADKTPVISSRDKSPVRGNRTRGQISPNLEHQDDGNKRSTRSAKTKDATDTLPPSSKRRRATSRDHR